jgi:hypothetical protein
LAVTAAGGPSGKETQMAIPMVEGGTNPAPILCQHGDHAHRMLCADNSLAIFNLGFVANLPIREPLAFYGCVSLIEQSLTVLAVDNVISPAVFSVLLRWVGVFRQKCGILLHNGLSGYRPPQHDEKEDFKRAITNAIPTSCHYYPWFAFGACIGAYFTFPELVSTIQKSPVEMVQAAIRMLPDRWVADVPLLVEILGLSSDAYANGVLGKTVERHAALGPGNQRAFEDRGVFARIREVIAKRLEQSPPTVIPESGTGSGNLADNRIRFDWDEREQHILIDGVPVDQYEGAVIQKSGWDKAEFERNAWIYLQCMQNVTYKNICKGLGKMVPRWSSIDKEQGIRPRAIEFAERLGLPPPPPRRRGRPPRNKPQ